MLDVTFVSNTIPKYSFCNLAEFLKAGVSPKFLGSGVSLVVMSLMVGFSL